MEQSVIKKALDLEKGQGFIIAHGFKGGYK